MSALAFQLQGLVSGCCYVSWCFTCDQFWITLTGLWPLCTCVTLRQFLCIQHSKQFLKSTVSCNSHRRAALRTSFSIQNHKVLQLTWPRGTPLVPDGKPAVPWWGAQRSAAQLLHSPIPPSGTIPLPEHPQSCSEATQPFTQPKISLCLHICESWVELGQFGSLY